MGNKQNERFKDGVDSVFKTQILMWKAWYHRVMRKLCSKIALKCMAKASYHKNREYEIRIDVDTVFATYKEKHCK